VPIQKELLMAMRAAATATSSKRITSAVTQQLLFLAILCVRCVPCAKDARGGSGSQRSWRGCF